MADAGLRRYIMEAELGRRGMAVTLNHERAFRRISVSSNGCSC